MSGISIIFKTNNTFKSNDSKFLDTYNFFKEIGYGPFYRMYFFMVSIIVLIHQDTQQSLVQKIRMHECHLV